MSILTVLPPFQIVIIKAALLSARFSRRARKRSLKRLSKMEADEKDKETLFLRDKIDQQQFQITVLPTSWHY